MLTTSTFDVPFSTILNKTGEKQAKKTQKKLIFGYMHLYEKLSVITIPFPCTWDASNMRLIYREVMLLKLDGNSEFVARAWMKTVLFGYPISGCSNAINRSNNRDSSLPIRIYFWDTIWYKYYVHLCFRNEVETWTNIDKMPIIQRQTESALKD